MIIYNENLDTILNENEIDLSVGHIVDRPAIVTHDGEKEALKKVRSVVRTVNGSGESIKVDGKEISDELRWVKIYVRYSKGEMAARRIPVLKGELAKVKEDIEQEAFGLVRDDYDEKNARAAEIINELRVLEGKEPRAIKTE